MTGTEQNPTRPRSMKRSYWWCIVTVAMVAVVLTFFTSTVLFQMTYSDRVDTMLREYGDVLAAGFSDLTPAEVTAGTLPASMNDALANNVAELEPRVTLIAPDGTVFYDNRVKDLSTLTNHADRPEVAAALAGTPTTVHRQSDTLGHEAHYYAREIPNGDTPVAVLRVGEEVNNIWGVTLATMPLLLAAAALIILGAGFLAWRLTDRLVEPIAKMAQNLNRIEAMVPYEELVPLAHTVQSDRKLREDNEQMRRDFTANVSHELKTPLTSISGYAELMETGMAKPEDVPEFARRIHKEARRMIALVSDILQLSELDSTGSMSAPGAEKMSPRVAVDLAALVREISQTMTVNARKAYVTLQYTAHPAAVMGQRDMLTELVTNLCDNAIRYNRPGGKVEVICGTAADGTAYLKVEDNGIGIPQDSQNRVFERFYRVDKSRSKATGGTGLGLAIVKHIAMLHGATIELKSQVGTGTTVEVKFPKM